MVLKDRGKTGYSDTFPEILDGIRFFYDGGAAADREAGPCARKEEAPASGDNKIVLGYPLHGNPPPCP
jgi:hypothetical protein